MPWVTADAPTRAELSACVECGLCLPVCPTYRLTGLETASPRGRLAAMSAVAKGEVAVDPVFEDVMTFCVQCRACEVVCPGLVPFGRAMEGARAELTAQRPTGGRRLRHLMLGRVLPSRSAVAAATSAASIAQRRHLRVPGRLGRGLTGLRPLQGRTSTWTGHISNPLGTPRGTVGLLSGCVMDVWFGRVHEVTIDLLRRAGYRVLVPVAQTCCGALAAHDGAAEAARRLAERNLAAFAGCDLVVADAAGCSAHLKGYGHWATEGAELASRARDVTEVIASLIDDGSLPRSSQVRGPVAVQDPCHLRHAQRITSAPRQILEAGGYRPVEIDADGMCCGAAGIYSLLRPAASSELGRRKADQVRASGTTIVASANPGCEMQLRAHLDSWYRIAHPVELYRESVGTAG